MALEQKGYMTLEELKSAVNYPSEERFAKGPVAVAECIHEIPCNPCEAACRQGAIEIGMPITNLPMVNEEKCTGCGLCIAHCSGLAIFVIDKTYSETQATVAFPYEYLPLPVVGQKIKGVNRAGDPVCDGEVVKVLDIKAFDRTPVVTIAIPKEFADEVRSIERKEKAVARMIEAYKNNTLDDDVLVCRCEEVTLGEIRQAIREGARDVTGVKRRTRAGMGLCQGRTCEKMVQAILKAETGETPEVIDRSTSRPPVRPVTFGSLAGGEDDE